LNQQLTEEAEFQSDNGIRVGFLICEMSSRRSFYEFLRTARNRAGVEGRMARAAIATGRQFTCTSIIDWSLTSNAVSTDAEHEALALLIADYECERDMECVAA
jgi:hypothetical protein